MPRTAKYPYRPDLHAKIIAAAASGKLVAYSNLGTSRAMVGNYLFQVPSQRSTSSGAQC
jgi:hypothetical protein